MTEIQTEVQHEARDDRSRRGRLLALAVGGLLAVIVIGVLGFYVVRTAERALRPSELAAKQLVQGRRMTREALRFPVRSTANRVIVSGFRGRGSRSSTLRRGPK